MDKARRPPSRASHVLSRYEKQRQAWDRQAERLAKPPEKRNKSGGRNRPGKKDREAKRAAQAAAVAEELAQQEAQKQATIEAQKAEIRHRIQAALQKRSPSNDVGAFVIVHPSGAIIIRAMSDREPYIFTSWQAAREYAEIIGGTAYPVDDPAVADAADVPARLQTDTGSDLFDLLDICFIGGAFEMKRRKH